MTVVTVCGNGHPYGRGDDETVVREHEGEMAMLTKSKESSADEALMIAATAVALLAAAEAAPVRSTTQRGGPSTASEFGYFCSSRSFRRKLWMALAVIALGAFALAVVLGGGHDPQDGAAPPNAAASSAGSAATVEPTAPTVEPTAPTPTAASSSPPETKAACEGDTWTYIDGKCIASNSPPVAAIPLGRTPPPPPVVSPPAKPERAAEAVAIPTAPKPERVAEVTTTTPATAEPTGQSASASKERRKASRERASRDDRRSVRAASSDNRMPRSAMGWTKQVRSAEQFMRALFSSGI